MSKFAILRTAKLKTIGNIAGSGSHNFRERTTANANPERTALNQHIGANSTDELVNAVKAQLPPKHRKNAVLCIEYLITASPEAMAAMKPADHAQYFSESLKWLRAKHGAENVVCASVHRDETTPHMVAYVVPVLDGKLNARAFLGGRKVLSEMQTAFVKDVAAKFGLERGVERSTANHKDVQQWYAEQAQAAAAVPAVDPFKVPFSGSVLIPEAQLSSLVKLAGTASDKKEEIKRAKAEAKRAKQAEAEALKALKARAGEIDQTRREAREMRSHAQNLTIQLEQTKMTTATQLKQLSEEKKQLIKATAELLKEQPKAELARLMGVELVGKQDVFDALVKSGKASSFVEAVTMTAQAYNEEKETKISALARWSLDYQAGESRVVDSDVSRGPRPSGMG